MSELVVLTPEQRQARKAAIRKAWGKPDPVPAPDEAAAAVAAIAAVGGDTPPSEPSVSDLESLIVPELRARAKAAGVASPGSLNRDALLEALSDPGAVADEE